MKLTPKQNAFCLAYAASGNATESYKQAGYTVKNDNVAAVEAYRLLNNPKILERLKEIPQLHKIKAEEEEKKKIADVQEIQEFLTAVMRQEKTEEEIVVVGDSEFREAVTKEKTPPISTAIKAAETLAKLQGAFRTDINITGALPVIISGDDELED